jgi:hypothetical protein
LAAGLGHLADTVFVSFLHWKVTLLPTHTVCLERSHMCSSQLQSHLSLRVENLHTLFEILQWNFVSSLQYIN